MALPIVYTIGGYIVSIPIITGTYTGIKVYDWVKTTDKKESLDDVIQSASSEGLLYGTLWPIGIGLSGIFIGLGLLDWLGDIFSKN